VKRNMITLGFWESHTHTHTHSLSLSLPEYLSVSPMEGLSFWLTSCWKSTSWVSSNHTLDTM